MATLLTLSGLLDWDDTVLEGLSDCIYSPHVNWKTCEYDYIKLESTISGVGQRAQTKIMLECGMLECIYQDPQIIKTAISEWVKANSRRWTNLFITSLYEYNPISNYDRKEEWEDTDEENETQSGEGSNTGNNNSTHNVGAYNNDMQKAGEDISYGSGSYNASGNKNTKKTSTHRARMYGNIGVTTTQEMIEAERRVNNFDVADVIANEFKTQFCIVVY